MKKMILLMVILVAFVISGCAIEPGGSGGYEGSSGHQGHHHY